MSKLYPLKFTPIIKERVWGCESWEISGVQDDISIVSEGFLSGNNLNDLVEIYLGDLVGDKVYEQFGNEFPILIKTINIKESLSLQMHPDDKTAIERHNSYGKTECWYILNSEPGAKIYLGLNKSLSAQEFYDNCKNGKIKDDLNVISPEKGTLIYIPPGTLHSASGGILVAEIQQVSDITYRVYDWGRENNPETARETHIDLAIDCVNLNKTDSSDHINTKGEISTPYFNIQTKSINSDYNSEGNDNDTFIIFYICNGSATILSGERMYTLNKGESILIPAHLGDFKIEGQCSLLEITPSVNQDPSSLFL